MSQGSTFRVAGPLSPAPGEASDTLGTTRHYTVYRIHELFVLALRVPPPEIPPLPGAWRAAGRDGLAVGGHAGGGWPRRLGLKAPPTPMESIQLYERGQAGLVALRPPTWPASQPSWPIQSTAKHTPPCANPKIDHRSNHPTFFPQSYKANE